MDTQSVSKFSIQIVLKILALLVTLISIILI